MQEEKISEIVNILKEKKCKIVNYKKNTIDQFEHVKKVFEEISTIKQFQFSKSRLNDNHFYYGCIILKEPIYILHDVKEKRILLCDYKSGEVENVPDNEYETISNSLKSRKSADKYINNIENLKNARKYIWIFLLAILLMTCVLYYPNKVPDNLVSIIIMAISLVLGLQDALDVIYKRFEWKKYDNRRFFLQVLEVAYILCIFSYIYIMFSSPHLFDSYSWIINVISALTIIAVLLFKFDNIKK